MSPEFLSDVLLITFNTPPFSLIAIALPLIASFNVFASLILTLVVMPPDVLESVIAKYTVLGSSPSGR